VAKAAELHHAEGHDPAVDWELASSNAREEVRHASRWRSKPKIAQSLATHEPEPSSAEGRHVSARNCLSSASRAAFSSLVKYADPPTSGCTRFMRRL